MVGRGVTQVSNILFNLIYLRVNRVTFWVYNVQMEVQVNMQVDVYM